MADEYIKREDALTELDEIGFCDDEPIQTRNSALKIIQKIPAADVRPVVHAHYIINEDGDPRCSACGAKYIDSTRRYCPDCGVRMDGADIWEVDDED